MARKRKYRLFGNELSPYSVKVRSYLRYKRVPHEWIIRNPDTEEEFRRYAKLPLIPLVVTPDGEGLQDSTPIIEHFEQLVPDPSITPADPALAFLSALLEEYGDEWSNKSMFHFRWSFEDDQASPAERLARCLMPGLREDEISSGITMVKERMIPRLALVGSSPETADALEGSLRTQVILIDMHLRHRPYLFGGRPALGDFGLFAQLHQCLTDPTPGRIIRGVAPHVTRWIEAMLSPRATGDFEPWESLKPTLMPFLVDQIGAVLLPWSAANAAAQAAGESTFTLTVRDRPFTQAPQKYAAKSLAALRARYAAVADKTALDHILREADCLRFLQ